jgi:hypothetical protein
MRYAGETARATTGKSSACIGGTGFSLSTPACGRTFSHPLKLGAPIRAPSVSEGLPLSAYSRSVSIRCAWTMFSQGDQAKTVNRPSCEATSATASCWSRTNCAAER